MEYSVTLVWTKYFIPQKFCSPWTNQIKRKEHVLADLAEVGAHFHLSSSLLQAYKFLTMGCTLSKTNDDSKTWQPDPDPGQTRPFTPEDYYTLYGYDMPEGWDSPFSEH